MKISLGPLARKPRGDRGGAPPFLRRGHPREGRTVSQLSVCLVQPGLWGSLAAAVAFLGEIPKKLTEDGKSAAVSERGWRKSETSFASQRCRLEACDTTGGKRLRHLRGHGFASRRGKAVHPSDFSGRLLHAPCAPRFPIRLLHIAGETRSIHQWRGHHPFAKRGTKPGQPRQNAS